MKKIDEYIEKIYRNFDEKDEETKVLKEETKVHLVEEVNEMIKQGLSEDESIYKAITNFGEEKIVIKEMSLILKKQNNFTKILKKLTLIFFIISCVCLSISIADEFINRNEPDPFTADKNTTSYLFDVIENRIKNEDVLDSNLKNEITQLIDEFNDKNNNGLYYIRISKEGIPDLNYEYKKDIAENMIETKNGGLSRIYNEEHRTWNIYYNRTDNQANYDYKVQQDAWNKMINRIPNRLRQISNYLFVVTVVLFFVYITNKVYLKSSFLRK